MSAAEWVNHPVIGPLVKDMPSEDAVDAVAYKLVHVLEEVATLRKEVGTLHKRAGEHDDVYFRFQTELGELLGCISHPNNITDAIRQLKEDADKENAKRRRRQDELYSRLQNVAIGHDVPASMLADDDAREALRAFVEAVVR